MSGNKPSRISWDSCILLGYFNGETNKPLDIFADMINAVEHDRAKLALSVICYSEVLNRTGSTAGDQFKQFVKRSNIMVANVDSKIADKAGELRVLTAGLPGRKLKTPDAIIVATAIRYGIEVLYSTDSHIIDLHKQIDLGSLKVQDPREWDQMPLFPNQ